jgi:hypothetical protein
MTARRRDAVLLLVAVMRARSVTRHSVPCSEKASRMRKALRRLG